MKPIDRAARIVEAALRESGRPNAIVQARGSLLVIDAGLDGPNHWESVRLVEQAIGLAEDRIGVAPRACCEACRLAYAYPVAN